MGFFDDVKNVGLFTAIECAAADMQYKADVALFEARSKRMANNLPLDVDVIDETLYGVETFKSLKKKVDWVCDNFEHTQVTMENDREWFNRQEK